MPYSRSILVVIRNTEGKFLAGDGQRWEFTADASKARVFDYLRDNISEQLDRIEREQSVRWAVVPVDPKDRYETCDRCGSRVVCRDAYFDGASYLCRACRPK